ncbi:hypothetical protein SEA_XKCD426_6 [Streptomyces phage Xkcd426]|nr:hypothetical protein SEA_XKCD426_6 [Streptomyces phage Xkcd426]
MGFSHSTYHFFGVHVPPKAYQTDHIQRESEWLDGVIRHTPGLNGTGLGHLTAGDYDRDMLFLCVVPDGVSCEVELGQFGRATREAFSPEWNQLLRQLAEAAGYSDLDAPAWLVVPDVS